MKLKPLWSNMTLVQFGGGLEILYSHETPVAGRNEEGLFRTEKQWSSTTSRHINRYLTEYWHVNPLKVRKVPQEAIDLFAEVEKSGCEGVKFLWGE